MSFYLSNIRSINKKILLKLNITSFINQKNKFIPSLINSSFNIVNKSLIIYRKFSSLADTPISYSINDTIYALSSATNTKAGIAVIRLSGPQTKDCLKKLLKPNTKFPLPRHASLRKLYCPKTNDILDNALVLWFPNPNSFTGEDVVELHIHGSRAVILGLFNALDDLNNTNNNNNNIRIRPAERGEFTRRAFDNGRMDLTEVEGLVDLLSAETSMQRKQALRQMEGYLRILFENWREILMKCLAHCEAVIDFGDDDREDDVNDSVMWQLLPKVEALKKELEIHLNDDKKGELVREGIKIALIGPPNAGKSSLLNALAKRPAAIVSPIAGTTRDIIEVRMDLGGISCLISDTAGLRSNSNDPIELEGINRAREAFNSAQIKVFVSDANDQESIQITYSMLKNLLEEYNELMIKYNSYNNDNDDDDDDDENEKNKLKECIKNYKVLLVVNKIDLLEENIINVIAKISSIFSLESANLSSSISIIDKIHPISCITNNGLTEFEQSITLSIHDLLNSNNSEEGVLITRDRHRHHIKQCIKHLNRFLLTTLPMDAAAEELRLASRELGKVTGRVDIEEILDIIFKDFCIGK